MPRAPFLLPGIGAQGGRVEDLAPAFAPGRPAGLVTASRSIVARPRAAPAASPAAAARAEAERLRAAAWALAERPDGPGRAAVSCAARCPPVARRWLRWLAPLALVAVARRPATLVGDELRQGRRRRRRATATLDEHPAAGHDRPRRARRSEPTARAPTSCKPGDTLSAIAEQTGVTIVRAVRRSTRTSTRRRCSPASAQAAASDRAPPRRARGAAVAAAALPRVARRGRAPAPPSRAAPSSAPAAILVQPADGRHRLRARARRSARPIASTTKLMTALLTLEQRAPRRRDHGRAATTPPPPSRSSGLRAGRAHDRPRPPARRCCSPGATTRPRRSPRRVGGSRRAFVRADEPRARASSGCATRTTPTRSGSTTPGNYSTRRATSRSSRCVLRRNAFFARDDRPSPRATLQHRRAPARRSSTATRSSRAVPWVNGVKTGHTARGRLPARRLGARATASTVVSVGARRRRARRARDADSLALLRYGLGALPRAHAPCRDGPGRSRRPRSCAHPRRARRRSSPASARARPVARRGDELAVARRRRARRARRAAARAARASARVVVRCRGRVVARVPLVTAARRRRGLVRATAQRDWITAAPVILLCSSRSRPSVAC